MHNDIMETLHAAERTRVAVPPLTETRRARDCRQPHRPRATQEFGTCSVCAAESCGVEAALQIGGVAGRQVLLEDPPL
jgi:hypothetical protein